MWKKLAIAGGVCAAIAGIGSVAVATSGGPATSGSPSSAQAGRHGDKAGGKLVDKALRRALHAEWVTKDGTTFVTHDAIRGAVTAVSATSITVVALDKKSETYTVTGDTKVRIRTSGKGAKGTISQVHTGDQVIVLGTGTTTLTARGVLDGAK